MPTYKKAVEYFLENDYDYHLWIEDDALVMDKQINDWVDRMKGSDVGEFIIDPKHPKYMMKSQILLGNREFNKRFYDECLKEKTWDRKAKMVGRRKPTDRRLEFKLKKVSRGRRTRVSTTEGYARMFWREPLSDKINMLNFLRTFVPENDLKYMKMDFDMGNLL